MSEECKVQEGRGFAAENEKRKKARVKKANRSENGVWCSEPKLTRRRLGLEQVVSEGKASCLELCCEKKKVGLGLERCFGCLWDLGWLDGAKNAQAG